MATIFVWQFLWQVFWQSLQVFVASFVAMPRLDRITAITYVCLGPEKSSFGTWILEKPIFVARCSAIDRKRLMKKPTIGLVDYGAGNCASVKRLISKLGYRSSFIKKYEDFERVNVLFVPGRRHHAEAVANPPTRHVEAQPVVPSCPELFRVVPVRRFFGKSHVSSVLTL